MRIPFPRSLAGQMALLIAIALFLAQAVNLGLLLRERATARIAQTVGPAAARVVDALDREAAGRPLSAERGRVRRTASNPVAPGLESQPDIEAGLKRELTEAGVATGRIVTGVRAATDDDPANRHMTRWRAQQRRFGRELVIGIEQPGRGWLRVQSFWPGSDAGLVWRLIAQTLILYGIILLPVLWIARRISRPLRALAEAATRFRPGDSGGVLPEQGPRDLQTLIAAFNALRLRVTAMLDEKDRMLGAIGHDLRTPLAALRVRIESVEDDADRTKMADTIEEMNRTLDDILSLARLGRPSEPPTDVDLAALVDAVVEDFRDLGEPVSFDEATRLPMRLRPALIRRAVRNLIENAVKYGHAADVTLSADAHTAAIVVADRGPGIPDERQEAVFDAFTRLETSRNRETGGIGLGLALARAIVREAGGDIALVNRRGGGLAATITLPRRAPA